MENETIKITALHRNDFRKWLEKNHQKEKKVCIVLHKRHTGKPAPTHRELMEEAICFGWIDTTVKRLDEDLYARFFAKRNRIWTNYLQIDQFTILCLHVGVDV